MNIRNRIYQIIEKASPDDKASRAFDIFIMLLIALNIIAVILETVRPLSRQFPFVFKYFEIFSVIVFSLEYLLRIWTCVINNRFKRPVIGRLKYMVTPLVIIDLLAILPFYIPMLIPIDLRFLRALRLIRFLRLFKLGRYSKAMQLLGQAYRERKEELLITFFVIGVLLIISSSIMYYFENAAQPEAFASIPAAMWWGVATLTTVGYGDVYPVTIIGKFLGAIIAILGIGVFALPTGIFASGIVEVIQSKDKEKETICPHCGKDINKQYPKSINES